MEEYVNALEEIPVRQEKKKVLLNSNEMKLLRRITGKISWIASNCRPDLSFISLKLSMKSKNATIEDIKYANMTVRKAKNKVSKVSYKFSPSMKDLVVYGLGDASYKAGEKAMGGQMILVGSRESKCVYPVFWRSKLIRKVCKSPKDSETLNLGLLVDLTTHVSNQLQQIMHQKCEVKLFTVLLGTLISFA